MPSRAPRRAKARRSRCGKVRYRDRQEALRSMRAVQRHSDRFKVPVRVYYCDGCRGYHLTSRRRGR